jgi:hypothetical protein
MSVNMTTQVLGTHKKSAALQKIMDDLHEIYQILKDDNIALQQRVDTQKGIIQQLMSADGHACLPCRVIQAEVCATFHGSRDTSS